MKKSVRVLGLVLITCVLSGLLFGCKSEDTAALTHITFWSSSGGGKAVLTEMVKEFNETIGKENDVVLDIEFKEGDLHEQVELAYQTGQAPDIYTTSYMEKYVESGYIAAIEDMPGGSDMLKNYEDMLIDGIHTYKGKTYCVPAETVTFALIYNKDLFKEAGIVDENGEAKPPETLDEMIEDAKKLTDKSKKQYGVIFPIKWGGFVSYELGSLLQSSYGRSEYDPVTGTYDFSVWKGILEFAKKLRDDGSLYPGAESMDNDPARARFGEGNIGMKFAVSWDTGVLNDQFPAKCDWGVAPMPVVDKNNVYLQKSKQNFGPFINKKSLEIKDPEKIMLVYKWYCGRDSEKRLYEECISLPVHSDIVEEAEIKNVKTGWDGFGNMVAKSHVEAPSIKSELGNNPTFANMFVNEFWQDKASADEIIERANKYYNEGIEAYKKNNPEYDDSKYIDKNWNIKK